MNSGLGAGIGIFYLALIILGLIVFVLWIFLPFAVFGIKNRLDVMIKNSEEITQTLKNAAADLQRLREMAKTEQLNKQPDPMP